MNNLAADFKPTPYWWEAAPPGGGTQSAPSKVYDAVVVGSGVTGLSAALTLAEGGRKVLICEAEKVGFGASTRNNGAVVPFLFLKQSELESTFGSVRGAAIARVAVDAFDHLLEMPKRYGFDIQLRTYDRYFLALTEKHRLRYVQAAAQQQRSGLNLNWQPIDNQQLIERTGLRGFHGAVFVPAQLAMHPGLCTAGLAAACRKAGVDIVEHCRVLGVKPSSNGHQIETQLGTVRARDVVIATNGYTGPEFPVINRRVMSVRLYMAATEPLPEELKRKIFPTPRQFADSKTNMTWIRPSPDGTRALIGGRAGMIGDDPQRHADTLHADMVRMIPELAPLKLTHCWYGLTGFPYDFVPHAGEIDGLHFAVGYCGIGMTMGSYLGTQVARKILGSAASAATALDELAFPRIPFSTFKEIYTRVGSAVINARDWWDLRQQ